MRIEPLLATLVAASLVVAAFAQALWGPSIPVATLGAVLVVGALKLTTGRLRAEVGRRGAGGGALALAALSPLWLGACHVALAGPILTSPKALSAWDIVGLTSTPLGIFFASWIANALVVTPAARLAASAWFTRSVRVLSIVAFAACGLLLVPSALRASRLPDARHVSEVTAERRTLRVESGHRTDLASGDQVFDDAVGGAWLRRWCHRADCQIYVVPVGTSPSEGGPLGPNLFAERHAQIEVVAIDGVWIVEVRHSAFGFVLPGRADGARSSPHVEDFLSPPRGWIAGAASGLLLALMQLARRRRVAKQVREVLTAREGIVDHAGIITLSDPSATQLRVPEGWKPRAGPCMVLDEALPPRAGGPYRDGTIPRAERVLGGNKAEAIEIGRASLFDLDASVLAISSLFGAPLLAALFHGLVL